MKKASFTTSPFQVQTLVLKYIQVTLGTLAEVLSSLCIMTLLALGPILTLK